MVLLNPRVWIRRWSLFLTHNSCLTVWLLQVGHRMTKRLLDKIASNNGYWWMEQCFFKLTYSHTTNWNLEMLLHQKITFIYLFIPLFKYINLDPCKSLQICKSLFFKKLVSQKKCQMPNNQIGINWGIIEGALSI